MDRESIGSNNPPGPIESAATALADISAWMTENPVVFESNVTEFKMYLDRGKNAIDDLEAARDKEVRPLNQKVKATNSQYREASSPLERLVQEIKDRLATWIRVEAEKRQAAALLAQAAAMEAEVKARKAEALEAESIENAKMGELVDVGLTIREADAAFNDFQRAERQAQRADRETHVKISGGFKHAISLRTKETLVVTDAMAAIRVMGITERILTAVLMDAREFRRKFPELPLPGIRVVEEQKL